MFRFLFTSKGFTPPHCAQFSAPPLYVLALIRRKAAIVGQRVAWLRREEDGGAGQVAENKSDYVAPNAALAILGSKANRGTMYESLVPTCTKTKCSFLVGFGS